VGGGGPALDVEDVEGGVGEGLAEDGLGVGAEGGVEVGVGGVGGEEGDVEAHALHGDGEEVEGAAVEGGGRDDVVAGARDVEDGEEVGGHAAGGEEAGGAAFHGDDLGGDGVVGGVLEAGVEVAFALEVEEGAHGIAGGVFPGGGLDDGGLAGFAVAGLPSALDAEGSDLVGLGLHGGSLLWWARGAPVVLGKA